MGHTVMSILQFIPNMSSDSVSSSITVFFIVFFNDSQQVKIPNTSELLQVDPVIAVFTFNTVRTDGLLLH